MLEKSLVENVVFGCVNGLNEQLPAELRVNASRATKIVGEGARLDSLSLVVLLVDVEETLSSRLGLAVNVLDEGLSPGLEGGAQFSNIGEMIDWIWYRHSGNE